jgi:hypothetical protein
MEVEVDAINAKAEAKRMRAEKGTAEAVAHVEMKYREELEAMDQEGRARAKELREDPEALAAFIVRGKG